MKDAVIILSGGMDSTTMLYEYKNEIEIVRHPRQVVRIPFNECLETDSMMRIKR